MDEKLAAAIDDAKNQQARGPGAICFLRHSTWDTLIDAARAAPAPTEWTCICVHCEQARIHIKMNARDTAQSKGAP